MRALSLLSLSFAVSSLAAPIYSIRQVPYSTAFAIYSFRDNGWVSGIRAGSGYFTSDGVTVTDYPSPAGGSAVMVVSASGLAAVSDFSGGRFRAYSGTGGVWTELPSNGLSAQPSGISDGGIIVGYAGPGGAIWTNGLFTPTPTALRAISPSGNALLGQSGAGIHLSVGAIDTTLPTPTPFGLVGINDSGSFVGYTQTSPGIFRVAVGSPSGYSLIPNADPQANDFPNSINNANQVLLYSTNTNGNVTGGFLWDAINGRRDLSDLAGIPISYGFAINNLGQILAVASSGQTVMLDPISPVPEPGTWALMAAGLLLAIRRRQS